MRAPIVVAGWISLTLTAACSTGVLETTDDSFGAGAAGNAADDGVAESTGADETAAQTDATSTGGVTGGETGGATEVVTGGGTDGASEAGESSEGGPSGTTEEPPPPPSCGDGQVDPGELCDDGNANDNDGCRNSCQPAACGDGAVQVGVEACDDGNQVDADACSNSCKLPGCGDGLVQPGEACDDGNNNDNDACLGTCTKAKCGDTVVQAGVEQCDTGGPSQQCNGNCTLSKCGDAVVNVAAGEQCDTAGASATCDADCTSVLCGDKVLNTKAGEQCDDGNAIGGDGCSAKCMVEPKGPQPCDKGVDPGTGSPWVVCTADANTAWLSSNVEGNYHIVKICQDLGYSTVGQWGGTAKSVCGFNQPAASCQSPGSKVFSEGAWKGVGNCGQDALGPIACIWVQWTCIK